MKNNLLSFLKTTSVIAFAFFLFAPVSFAHVVVKPAEVPVGAFQTFTVGVPNEADTPVTQLRLVVPDGLNHVTPNVKQGWEIEVKETGEGDHAKVTEIVWTGGSIPTGQRDEFNFSGQVPEKEAKLHWKAYQTYEDGTEVAWDASAEQLKGLSDAEQETKGPYSTTTVINDVAPVEAKQTSDDKLLLFVASAAVILSLFSLGLQFSKKK